MTDFTNQAKRYLKDLAGDDLQDVASLFDSGELLKDVSVLKVMEELMKYQGFDPKVMAGLLYSSWQSGRAVAEDQPDSVSSFTFSARVNNKDVAMKVTSNDSFAQDIKFLCMVFISRGSSIQKIKSRSIETLKQIMEMYVEKYDINTDKKLAGAALSPSTVTLPRICATFPTTTVDLFNSNLGRTLIGPEELFEEEENAPVLPRALFAPMVASTIPASVSPTAFLFYLALKVDELLHPKPSERTSPANLKQYLMAAVESKATTHKLKLLKCKSWGILTQAGTLEVSVAAASQMCLNKISGLYANAPNRAAILDKLR